MVKLFSLSARNWNFYNFRVDSTNVETVFDESYGKNICLVVHFGPVRLVIVFLYLKLKVLELYASEKQVFTRKRPKPMGLYIYGAQ